MRDPERKNPHVSFFKEISMICEKINLGWGMMVKIVKQN